MKILHLEPERYNKETRLLLEQAGTVDYFPCHDQMNLLEKVRKDGNTEVVFTKLGLAIDNRIMNYLPGLKYIVTPTTGLNHIDLEAAEAKKIEVISLKGETAFLEQIKSTAEHTWAILLALLRHIPHAHFDVIEGKWRREPFLATELNGKTIGIIGFGRLGKMIARHARSFDMTVMAHDIDDGAFTGTGMENTGLEELLATADIVSLHIPSNESTAKYLNKDKIDKMKKGAWIVNTARGEVIDGKALVDALNNGKITGAALDVLEGDSEWSGEVDERDPLWQYAVENQNLLLTPHMGGYGRESIENTRKFIVQKFLALLDNR